jgi:hypothetical protein
MGKDERRYPDKFRVVFDETVRTTVTIFAHAENKAREYAVRNGDEEFDNKVKTKIEVISIERI